MTQQINLYDASLRRRREPVTAANLAIVAVLLLVIVVAAGFWARSSAAQQEAEAAELGAKSKSLEDQALALSQQAQAIKPDAKLAQDLADLKLELSAHGDVLGLLQKGLGPQAVSFAEYLRGFARQTPQGLWLTGFNIDADGAGMQIQGRTTDPALVPEYIRRLNTEKAFQGQEFATLQMSLPQPDPGSKADDPLPAYHEFTLAPAQAATAQTGQTSAQKMPPMAQAAVGDLGNLAGTGHP